MKAAMSFEIADPWGGIWLSKGGYEDVGKAGKDCVDKCDAVDRFSDDIGSRFCVGGIS